MSTKAFELFIGYKLVVNADSVDEVRAAGRALAKNMRMAPAEEVIVRETLPEKGDGRWRIADGTIVREPLQVNTLRGLADVKTMHGDLAEVAEADSQTYVYMAPQPDGKKLNGPPGTMVESRHGGHWIQLAAVQEMMTAARSDG